MVVQSSGPGPNPKSFLAGRGSSGVEFTSFSGERVSVQGEGELMLLQGKLDVTNNLTVIGRIYKSGCWTVTMTEPNEISDKKFFCHLCGARNFFVERSEALFK